MCQIFLRSFQKWIHRGPKMILWPHNLDIWSATLRQLHGYPPTLGWVNLKHVFRPCQILASQWHFSMLILVSGAIFSAPNGSTPKWKLTGHPRQKNTLIWHMKVSGWHIKYTPGGKPPNSSTIHLSGPNFVANHWSET